MGFDIFRSNDEEEQLSGLTTGMAGTSQNIYSLPAYDPAPLSAGDGVDALRAIIEGHANKIRTDSRRPGSQFSNSTVVSGSWDLPGQEIRAGKESFGEKLRRLADQYSSGILEGTMVAPAVERVMRTSEQRAIESGRMRPEYAQFQEKGWMSAPNPTTIGEKIAGFGGDLTGMMFPVGGAYSAIGKPLTTKIVGEGTGLAARAGKHFLPGAIAGGLYGAAEGGVEEGTLGAAARQAAEDALLFGGGDIALRGVGKGFGEIGKRLAGMRKAPSLDAPAPEVLAPAKKAEPQPWADPSNRREADAWIRMIQAEREAEKQLTRPVLPIAREKYSIMPSLSKGEAATRDARALAESFYNQPPRTGLTPEEELQLILEQVRLTNEGANAEAIRLAQELANTPPAKRLPIRGPGIGTAEAVDPMTGYMHSDNKGILLRPEATPAPEPARATIPRNMPKTARRGFAKDDSISAARPEVPRVEPLPEGVGAMKYNYDTKQSIKSLEELREPLNVVEKAKVAYRKTVDRLRVFNDVDQYIRKTTGKTIAADKDLYTAATNTRSADGMAARTMEVNMVDFEGNPVAPSLKSVVDKAASAVGGEGNWKAFEDYLKLKHSLSWMKKGRHVYPPESGLDAKVNDIKNLTEQMGKTKDPATKAQIQAQIDAVSASIEGRFTNPRMAAYEAQYPEIAQAAREYMDWINKFGEEWGVKTGLIKPSEWAALRAEYPDYVPLQRVMEAVEEGGMGTSAGFVNQPKPIKKGKGSERDTIESLDVMIERIPQLINEAKKNAVGQNFVELIRKHPQEMLDAFGAKIVAAKPGEAIKPNVVKVREGGNEIHVEMTNPALLEGMKNLSTAGQDAITKTVRNITSIMKTLTTGVNPLFALIRNPLYDTPAAYAYSKTLSKKFGINNPVEFTADLIDSYVRILTNEKWHKTKDLQMYRDMGGGTFTSASADRNVISEAKARVLPGYLSMKKPVRSAGRLAKMGYEGLQKIMSATETGPRLPEFIRAVKKYGNTYASRQKGLYESHDITYNYSRSGEVSKFIDAYFPYFNAAIQGIDKFARVAKESPKSLIANSIAAVTGLEMGLYMLNKDNPDYKRLSEVTKSRYYCIPKGDGTFIKLVKPREIGVVFGTAVVDVLDYMKERDPRVFESLKVGFENSFLPSARSISAPISDLRANKDFADRPIVPAYMLDQSPGTQADIKTSRPAKWLGGKMNVSPKKIDHVINSYGGILAQLGLPASSEGGSVREVLSRQITADPAYSNDVVSRFYEAKDKLDRASVDAKIDGQGLVGDDEKLRKLYGKVSETISNARTQIREVENDRTLSADVKKAKLRGMQMAIVEMAEVANKPLEEQIAMYDQLKKKKYIVETKPKTTKQLKTSQEKEQKKYSAMADVFR